jgi:hypothetical protein
MKTNSKMRRIYILVILGFLIPFCKAQNKSFITNIKDANSLENNSAIYALPRTIINITLEARRTTTIPGPFYEYTDKYLGIQNVPDSENTEWDIIAAEIDVYQEADPEYFFSVSNKRSNNLNHMLSRLAKDSLILFPEQFFKKHSLPEPNTSFNKKIHYRDLSVKRNFHFVDDTTYKDVFKDSTYIRVPVVKEQLVRKTPEDKAEEAANYIIKIRKRKFKLLSGQYDYMPEGEALGVAVKELNKLENEYLSLFTGKSYVEHFKKTYQYIPDNSRKISKEILCRFSAAEGFVDSREVRGKPVIIEIEDMDQTIYLEKPVILENEVLTGSYAQVRLPDLAYIKVLLGDNILNLTKAPVFQYGSIVPFSFRK